MNILSAQEARKSTNKQIQQCNTKEIDNIMIKIKDAMNNGKYSINLYEPITKYTILKLLELGYEVKSHTQYNEVSINIKW